MDLVWETVVGIQRTFVDIVYILHTSTCTRVFDTWGCHSTQPNELRKASYSLFFSASTCASDLPDVGLPEASIIASISANGSFSSSWSDIGAAAAGAPSAAAVVVAAAIAAAVAPTADGVRSASRGGCGCCWVTKLELLLAATGLFIKASITAKGSLLPRTAGALALV
jgi:hypothetical protein